MLDLKSEQSSCCARLTLWSTAGFITHPAASHQGAIKMFRASVSPFSSPGAAVELFEISVVNNNMNGQRYSI